MDLHNRLKERNNLPEDHVLKVCIYEDIHQNKKANLVKRKEAFPFPFLFICLFLRHTILR
ncbi:hypothetical protein [Lysinibacillus contaminans]|uniref:hypothetical protein n=1 Tax=Lysinibacillus contaminans TaxID=1293441 RepID=UPI001FDF6186|nr:hypothetical protein [Lysinibacillus contaminans]